MNTEKNAKPMQRIRHHLNVIDMLFNLQLGDLDPEQREAYMDAVRQQVKIHYEVIDTYLTILEGETS